MSTGTKGRVVGILVILLLSSFIAVSLETVGAEDANIVVNGGFRTGDLSGWTLEYAAAGGVESLNYKPSVSSGGHNGSNFVYSALYNFGYSSFTLAQKLPPTSSSNKYASCWTGWSFGGYFRINYTDGSYDEVLFPERLAMSPWTQVVLSFTSGKTLDSIIIHGDGSGGHNGGLTVSDVQVLTCGGSNLHPSKAPLAQFWLHEQFLLPLAFSGLIV